VATERGDGGEEEGGAEEGAEEHEVHDTRNRSNYEL
jgi:hypothetical protein